MKKIKKLIVVTLLAIVALASGCKKEVTIHSANAAAQASLNGLSEWVSPDGVHYWVVSYSYQYGLAPRYDSNGNLVIDELQPESIRH